MFRKILMVMLVGVILLTACAGALAASTPDVGPADPTKEPADVEPTRVPWEAGPDDERLQRAEVEVELSEILTLESFPPQYLLHVTGWQGNPCNQLRVKIGEPDDQNRIAVEVYTLYDPAAFCIQILKSFDVKIPLGTLEKGEYTVVLNGAVVGTIVAP